MMKKLLKHYSLNLYPETILAEKTTLESIQLLKWTYQLL